MISYEELKNTVPKETMEVIDNVLPYLDAYVRKDQLLYFDDKDLYTSNFEVKTFFLLIFAMCKDKEMESFFSNFGFDKNRYYQTYKNLDFNQTAENLYSNNSYLLPQYKDKMDYETLTPIDLLLYWLKKYYSDYKGTLYDKLFPMAKSINSFEKILEEKNNSIKNAKEHELEKEVYNDLPISVIDYLETASKIRQILVNMDFNKNAINKTDDDITALSLLLSLYYYKCPKVDDKLDTKTIINEYLESKGLKDNDIMHLIGSTFSKYDIESKKRSVLAIKKYYSRYFNEGIYKNKDKKEVTVSGIIDNLFDRNVSQSYAVEKIISILNCDINDFKNFSKKINSLRESKERAMQEEFVNSFYKYINADTREFIEFTTKTYLLILDKMESGKHNKELLNDNEDADTLALFVASYFYNTDVSKFFENNGITLEKVLSLININLTKEEIVKKELNQKVLVDIFKRFVEDGVNQNKYSKNVTINDVSHNLCNRDFNKTMILEKIFNENVKDKNIEGDFLKQLYDELKKEEKIRKVKLAQKIFKNSSVEAINYYEKVSKMHNYYHLNENLDYTEKDSKFFILLLGLVSIDSDIKKFFDSLGINEVTVCNYLNIFFTDYANESEVDIDILSNEYIPYIKSLMGDKEKEEITLYDVAKLIFSDKDNNSVNVKKLLSLSNIKFEDFKDFDKLYQDYLNKKEKAQEEENNLRLVKGYYGDTDVYIEKALKIYDYINERILKNEYNNILVKTSEDIVELSIIVAILLSDTKIKRFFEKNKVTLDNVLKIVGLDYNTIEEIDARKVDYSIAKNHFDKYLERDNRPGINKSLISLKDIAKRMFESSNKDSSLLENIMSKCDGNYDILKKEVESEKDYDLLLSVDERIEILSNQDIDEIDEDNIQSILKFGNSLTMHSKYIYDELPKLTLNDSNTKSIETIQELADKVYKKENSNAIKHRRIFSRLFTTEPENDSKIIIDYDALKELKQAIDDSIKSLSQELLSYDSIRKYLEIYRKKNKEYYLQSEKIEKNVEETLSNLNPEDEEEYDRFVQLGSLLQIMRDKTNRFRTTNRIAQQDLIRINQSIANHFITINALEMAKNDLLPLIVSELAMSEGKKTEKEALKLSKNIIGLFTSLLTRNVGSTKETVQLLKDSMLPDELFDHLNSDIENYLEGIRQQEKIEEISDKPKQLLNKPRRND